MITYALMVVYYEVIDLPNRLHIQPNDFTPSKRSFFRRLAASQSPVTLHEVLVRIWCVFEFIILDWASLTAIHSVFASISVSLHLDLPKHWPPLFGSIRETYSLRNYWAKFWHLLFYRMGKLLGYLWVYGFLFWSVPKIQYPALYGGDGLQW